MKTNNKIAVSLVLQMTQYITQQGINLDASLAEVNIDPVILESPDSWISINAYNELQERAISATGDAFFGLHVGERAATSSWSILGYIMMNSRTLGEALKRTEPYSDIVGGILEVTSEREADQILVNVQNRQGTPKQSRHCFDTVLASFATILNVLTHNQFSLTEVRMENPIPNDVTEYQRIFNCPLLFDQELTSLVFHQRLLDTQIVYSNPDMLKMFERHAENLYDRFNNQKTYTRKASQLLIERIQRSALSIKELSSEMAMSVRSLQLKLREEGTTYTQIVENIRKELAQSYLKESIHSVSDIACLLGFSEPSVFHRVFKKWMGITPRQYRLKYSSKNSF